MAKKSKQVIEVEPVEGAQIFAHYMKNGKIKHDMSNELGKVVAVDGLTFTSKGEDGIEYKRKLTFGAINGIRLIGFIHPKKKAPRKTKSKTEE